MINILCNFQRTSWKPRIIGRQQTKVCWWPSKRKPPVPIPNTVVKTLSGDNTWRATSWEDNSLPTSNLRKKENWLDNRFSFFYVIEWLSGRSDWAKNVGFTNPTEMLNPYQEIQALKISCRISILPQRGGNWSVPIKEDKYHLTLTIPVQGGDNYLFTNIVLFPTLSWIAGVNV